MTRRPADRCAGVARAVLWRALAGPAVQHEPDCLLNRCPDQPAIGSHGAPTGPGPEPWGGNGGPGKVSQQTNLKDGDLVYVQTRLNNYTYRVIGKQWVAPTDTAVLDPVPGHPRQRPARRLLSLITCDPAWTGTHRVIVTGVLVAARPR